MSQPQTPGSRPEWKKGRGARIFWTSSPLVLGVLALGISLFLSYIIGGLLGLAAIAWGRAAYGMAKVGPQDPGAKGMAIAGIVLGAASVVAYIVGRFVLSS